MAWCYEKDVGIKWFNIDCICFNDSECVVGDAEEELIIECSIDQSEEVSLPRLNSQFEGI